MNAPLVSVIVPTRNSARTLEACLRSIRGQSYPALELLVVDNCSEDGSADIARRFGDKVFVKGPERSVQRNIGLAAATGEFVLFVDSDMVLSPGVISECVGAMGPAVSGVVIPEESFGEGFWARCKALEKTYYLGVGWMEAARFFRRSDALAAGGYDESLVSTEDWDLSERMALRGTISRVAATIRHDEGRTSFLRLLRKKAYYASRSRSIAKSVNPEHYALQRSILRRYGLFCSDAGTIRRQPLTWAGMIFLKTCEFAAGAFGLLHRP